jgi:hypothetical protein
MHLKSMAGSTTKMQNNRLRDQGPFGEKVNRKTRELFSEKMRQLVASFPLQQPGLDPR